MRERLVKWSHQMRSADDLPLADETFETGRTRRNLLIAFFGTFTFIVGCGLLPRPWEAMKSAADVFTGFALGLTLIAVGGIAALGGFRSYRISVVALFPEGLLFRNWRAGRTFVPWDRVVEVYIDRWGLSVTGVLAQTARSVHLTVEMANGSVSKMKLSTEDKDERAVRLALEIARRASLEHRGIIRPSCEVWNRPAGGDKL